MLNRKVLTVSSEGESFADDSFADFEDDRFVSSQSNLPVRAIYRADSDRL